MNSSMSISGTPDLRQWSIATLKSSSSRAERPLALVLEGVLVPDFLVSDLTAAPDLAASEPVGVAIADDMVMLVDGYLVVRKR